MKDESRDFFYILLTAVVVLIGAVIYKCCSFDKATYGDRGLLDTNKKEVVYGTVH